MNIEKYKYKLLIGDYFILLLSFYLTSFFQSYLKNWNYYYNFGDGILSLIIFSLLSVVILLTFQFNNLYKIHIFLSKTTQALKIAQSLTYSSAILILVSFLFKISIIIDSRVFILIFFVISISLVTFIRIFILRPIYLSRKTLYDRRILLVGTQKSALFIAAKFYVNNDLGVKIIGYLSENKCNNKLFNEVECLGTISELEDVVKNHHIDEVIISLDEHNPDKILALIDKCNQLGVSVKVSSELFRIVKEKIEVENYSGIYLINATPRVDETSSLFFKRAFDFIITFIALIILSPLMLIIAIIIKLTSKGPIIFKQIRIGKDGNPFVFYKFRSMINSPDNDKERQKMMINFMKNNVENKDGMNKIINEKRLTTIGKLIRKTSIDELPQLFNVLKGDMSLVGPRPCLPYEFENYDEWQKRRLSVIPGCTGVWQVYGRGKVSFFDSIILDIFYVNNMSPWLDLLILLKTVPVIILARGGK